MFFASLPWHYSPGVDLSNNAGFNQKHGHGGEVAIDPSPQVHVFFGAALVWLLDIRTTVVHDVHSE